MRKLSRSSCYVCGYTKSSCSARNMHFHSIPVTRTDDHVRDQWFEFLHLPPTANWKEDLWKDIVLCSRHFDEGAYNPQHKLMFRVNLKKGSAPSKNRPTGPGVLGELFSQSPGTCSDLSSPPIADSSLSQTSEKGDASVDHLTQHYSADNQEDLIIDQNTLENLRKELCRLCGQKGSVLSPIFEPTSDMSKDVPVSSKIAKYLPIKVELEDSLPFCICSNCLEVLNHWDDLYKTCVAVDALLLKTFGKESHVLGVNNQCSSVVQRNAETQTEERSLDASMNGTATNDFLSNSHTDKTRGNENTLKNCQLVKNRESLEDTSFKGEFNNKFHCNRKNIFKCHFCAEIFRTSSARMSHNRMCRQLSTICELCGLNVPRKNLMKHKYNKHYYTPRKYLCDKCHKFCTSINALKLHLQEVHGSENTSIKYCCELCGAMFALKSVYQQHKKRHEKGVIKTEFQIEKFRQEVNSESSENVVYVCPVCQENFKEVSSLAVHLIEKKKLKCSLCPKVLNSEKKLFLHVCGQWTCQYCLKSFDTRVKWVFHERWHTGEKPIKCRKCDQTFRTWHNRRVHEAKHEPPFQCVYCGKNFRHKRVFQDHVICHEGKKFSCHICNKKFSGRKSLGRHLNSFHKNPKNLFVRE